MQDFPNGIAEFIRQRKLWERRFSGERNLRGVGSAAPARLALTETERFGSNPGNLRMLSYAPESAKGRSALVVILHGCGQTAEGYGLGAEWIRLAEEEGFLLLLPEQRQANNAGTCFNWFLPDDTQRQSGEPASIGQMIAAMHEHHAVDPDRIFVTGLSAGGAMTSVMLATHPEIFAGGAIMAGLPFGAAKNHQEAFSAMARPAPRSGEVLGERVRAASRNAGPWPKLSVWQGTADDVVSPENAAEIVKQWTNLHGVDQSPSRVETGAGYSRRVWQSAGGEDVIEEYVVEGMGHGTPIDNAASGGDRPGPFLLDVGISSSRRVAEFWGLARPARTKSSAAPSRATKTQGNPLRSLIEEALRTARLKSD